MSKHAQYGTKQAGQNIVIAHVRPGSIGKGVYVGKMRREKSYKCRTQSENREHSIAKDVHQLHCIPM